MAQESFGMTALSVERESWCSDEIGTLTIPISVLSFRAKRGICYKYNPDCRMFNINSNKQSGYCSIRFLFLALLFATCTQQQDKDDAASHPDVQTHGRTDPQGHLTKGSAISGGSDS
ncbi:MAG: hypothetical protein HY738_06415, partial [Bacteroidia bacterium]|nr:hypothetical protein [Bacteroidia bacterium]